MVDGVPRRLFDRTAAQEDRFGDRAPVLLRIGCKLLAVRPALAERPMSGANY